MLRHGRHHQQQARGPLKFLQMTVPLPPDIGLTAPAYDQVADGIRHETEPQLPAGQLCSFVQAEACSIPETLPDSHPARMPDRDCTKASARRQMGASEFLRQAGAQCRQNCFGKMPTLNDQ